jgi:hypothetical protein
MKVQEIENSITNSVVIFQLLYILCNEWLRSLSANVFVRLYLMNEEWRERNAHG